MLHVSDGTLNQIVVATGAKWAHSELMADPTDSNGILAAPTDASQATGTEEILATPASNPWVALVYGADAPPRTFGYLSFNVGQNEYLNDEQWAAQCQTTLGYQPAVLVEKFTPAIADYRSFFGSTPTWILFAGHFTIKYPPPSVFGSSFYSPPEYVPLSYVLLKPEGVEVHTGTDSAFLSRGKDFHLHELCQVTFWCGCSAAALRSTVDSLRSLFGSQHLLLGFRESTNWFVSYYMLGGIYTLAGGAPSGITSGHFYDNVKARPDDLEAVRDAWLDAALACMADQGLQDNFIKPLEQSDKYHFASAAAVDPSGQAWGIENGVKARIKLSGD